ncbi:MAG: hypothetical protein M3347_09665 [Armatimonadota bacterium]|nr:hypothetical protein [Armatimonadota bacterium]
MKRVSVWTTCLTATVLCGLTINGVRADHKSGHSAPGGAGADAMTTTGVDERTGSEMHARNAEMVIQTLNEERTEIQQLAAQAAQFLKMGGRENRRIGSMLNRWIKEHKAAGPKLMALATKHGGNPAATQILKPPALGDKGKMLHATMVDHMNAESSSQMRYKMATDPAIKSAMRKRARLARKHMREMMRYHNAKNCPMCAQMKGGTKSSMSGGGEKMAMMCPHCNVKMVNGKCPMCGMTAEQMKS